jgi:hypothetical protein
MSAPHKVVEEVQRVLKLKAKQGKTTKNDAVLMVYGKIEQTGGPTKYGIGAAAMRMALKHIIEVEVSRQLKSNLSEHEYKFILPASTPMEVIAALGRAPRWIAIEEGPNAIWKFSLTASPDDWMANAGLKYKKAQQTRGKAQESEEIAVFLRMHKFNSLAEALSVTV